MADKREENQEKVRKKSFIYLGITLFFIMLPYIIKVAAVFLTNLEFDLTEDFSNGSFVMYSISLLAPIWYTVETIFDSGINQNGEKVPVTETIITLIGATALYVLLYICSSPNIIVSKEPVIVFKVPVIVLSLLLMVWSTHLAYKIHVNDMSVQEPNKKRIIDENGIKKSMDAVEEGGAVGKKTLGIRGDLESFSEEDFEEEEDE